MQAEDLVLSLIFEKATTFPNWPKKKKKEIVHYTSTAISSSFSFRRQKDTPKAKNHKTFELLQRF